MERWRIKKLAEYDHEIDFIDGKENVLTDVLSRKSTESIYLEPKLSDELVFQSRAEENKLTFQQNYDEFEKIIQTKTGMMKVKVNIKAIV